MKRTRTKRMCFFLEGIEMRKEKDMGEFPFVIMGFGLWWYVWYLKCDRIINHPFWFVDDKLFE